MNATKKLMLVVSLFLQISNNVFASDNNLWNNAITAFGGVNKIKPKSMPLEQAVKIAKQAGNTPEAQAVGLYVADKMTKSRFPKAAGNVIAALQAVQQAVPVSKQSDDIMDMPSKTNNLDTSKSDSDDKNTIVNKHTSKVVSNKVTQDNDNNDIITIPSSHDSSTYQVLDNTKDQLLNQAQNSLNDALGALNDSDKAIVKKALNNEFTESLLKNLSNNQQQYISLATLSRDALENARTLLNK